MSAFDSYIKAGLNYDAAKEMAEASERAQAFERELADLINRHNMENASGTPDFIIAGYLAQQLQTFNMIVQRRANWRDESIELPALTSLPTDATPAAEKERISTEDEALEDGVDVPPSGEVEIPDADQ